MIAKARNILLTANNFRQIWANQTFWDFFFFWVETNIQGPDQMKPKRQLYLKLLGYLLFNHVKYRNNKTGFEIAVRIDL